MRVSRRTRRAATTALTSLALTTVLASPGLGQPTPPTAPAQPRVGQRGKDVVWVPTSGTLVEKMLDMARVTSEDHVIDLGSGDGRTVIAAAKRGARAVGVEFDAALVTVSRRLADEAGVAERATFVQGDMYAADISKATVLALFLLPQNLERLRDSFLALAPGTRIVINTYEIPGWTPDAQETLANCAVYCVSQLYIVPAHAQGRWRTARGELVLDQTFQVVSGTLNTKGRTLPVRGRLRGTDLEVTAGGETLRTSVKGDRLSGELSGERVSTR